MQDHAQLVKLQKLTDFYVKCVCFVWCEFNSLHHAQCLDLVERVTNSDGHCFVPIFYWAQANAHSDKWMCIRRNGIHTIVQ